MHGPSGNGRRRLFVPLFLLLCLVPDGLSAGRDADRAALVGFKGAVSDDPGGLLSRWLDTDDLCSWPGVSCDAAGRVVALEVSGARGGDGALCSFGYGPPRRACADPAAARLVGRLSPAIGLLTQLRVLRLPFHEFAGEIPDEIWRLQNLEVIDLEGNSVSGAVPSRLPPRLRVLNLASNRIHGEIPSSLASCVDLEAVDLSRNQISGSIPSFFGALPKLRELHLSFNRLRGSIPREVGFGCQRLEHLDLSGNLLVNRIPVFLGNCRELRSLLLSSNFLEGSLPADIGRLAKLQVLDVSRNKLRGSVPADLGHCLELSVLVLSNPFRPSASDENSTKRDRKYFNYFQNGMPESITSLPKLRVLWAPRCTLGGVIPSNWGACANLEVVNLGENSLTGEIPEIFEQCKNLKHLNLSSNRLSGRFKGKLPVPCLDVFDVSGNLLSGAIPRFSANSCRSPKFVVPSDLASSYSAFLTFRTDGESPLTSHSDLEWSFGATSLGVNRQSVRDMPTRLFLNYPISQSNMRRRSLASSSNTTTQSGSSNSSSKRGFSSIEIASITSAAAIVSVLLALVVIYLYSRKCVRRSAVQSSERREVSIFVDIGVPITYENVVKATGNFNGSNCIGSGGFGATYKAEIAPGVLVAIKRLAVGRLQGFQQFDAEIRTLGRWRHPNLVTLIGYHFSEAETFLIYNYLPGGNLEKFLKERSKRAVNWRMLHKIALDVAQALAYLHDHQPRILHRDVKPSNILLDNDLNAYLSDFGLARLLGNSETHVTTGVAGTFGYVAPEYAMTCRVSDKADVYSYGVVLLELISDKKVLDPSFSQYGNGFNVVAWAMMLLRQGRAREFFIEGLWDDAPHDDLVDTLHLAVKCTDDSLSNRPTMKQVLQRLRQIRPPS